MKIKIIISLSVLLFCIILNSCTERESIVEETQSLEWVNVQLYNKGDSTKSNEQIQDPPQDPPKDRDNWKTATKNN